MDTTKSEPRDAMTCDPETSTMKTRNVERVGVTFTRVAGAMVFALGLTTASLEPGCALGGGGGEGDRCNPDLSHNDCNSGLTCQVPADPVTGATCGESYCCPTPATGSPNGYCNGANEAPRADGTLQCPVPAGASSSSASVGADASTE
jgi:hypothetical protein